MTLKIKVYSDYVCPFCYLGKAPLEQAIRGKDVEVEWMPFELRPFPAEPLDPVNDPSKRNIWESTIIPYAERWGVNMRLPNVSPHPYTHLAFEGYQYAKEHGRGNEYNSRLFDAFFQEEQNIGNIDVLAGLAGEVGLDQKDFKSDLESRKYKEVHKQALHHAYHEANIAAVPTFVIGDKVVQGIASEENFEQMIQDELNKQLEKEGK
ncbi:DsbA family oxidoreductase [Paenibacillus alkalitolerans]|uniref:DsbA family oxidoreductase n=1 Tax=Paenibacillus alkalitolerans TaxID=2799335 RepID=UPI0018F3E6A1|nr:DsbA family protein [Paenibacillus alkalitolerans]